MGRRRRRSRGGGVTRRRFLAGGLLGLGGASILGGTQAFSQADAIRAASIETAGDGDALLGVDPVTSVQQGDSGVELVTLTNNTDNTLTVNVALEDPSQGGVSPTSTQIVSGDYDSIDVSVRSDSPTGTGALEFSVSATDGEDFSVSLKRTVDVMEGPELLHYVADQSRNTNTQYTVQFDVNNITTFDHVKTTFQRQGSSNSTVKTVPAREGQVSYSDGGAMGETYDIRIEVFETPEANSAILEETITDVADGSNPQNNDDLGGPDSPQLDSFTVYDYSQHTNTDFVIEYQVSNTDRFEEVAVTLNNQNNTWERATRSSTSEPTGTVSYSQGGTENDTYDITVDVVNDSGITTASQTITYESGSSGQVSWP